MPFRTLAPRLAVAAPLSGLLAAGGVRAATGSTGKLDWQAARNRVDAKIEHWPLHELLSTIAASTGWEVYLEPGAALEVTTRFENLSQTDALRRLLGRLNFALLPQPEGPTKLYVFRTSATDATERVAARTRRGRAPGSPIPGERIVILADGADAEALARRLGARISGSIAGMHAYRLVFESEEKARAAAGDLARDAAVKSIETNVVIAPPAVVEPASANPASSFALRPDASPSSDKVVVGLVDTAVQTQDSRVTSFLAEAVSVAGSAAAPGDTPTHGTTMAATIVDSVAQALRERGDTSGTAPLSILPIDVYGPSETTSTFDVANGIFEALTRHANVVNLSLAADGDSVLVRALIEEGCAPWCAVLRGGGQRRRHRTGLSGGRPGRHVRHGLGAGGRRGRVGQQRHVGRRHRSRRAPLHAPGPGLVRNRHVLLDELGERLGRRRHGRRHAQPPAGGAEYAGALGIRLGTGRAQRPALKLRRRLRLLRRRREARGFASAEMSHPSALVVDHGLADLRLRVHDERALPDDRLVDRLAAEQ